MPNDLSNLKITEVAFCKRGMNKHARIALFKSADGATEGGTSAVPPAETKDDPNMAATEAQVADLTKNVEALTKSLEEANDKLAKAEAMAKATDAEKEYLASLDDDAKGKFMALSAEEKAKKLATVKKSDETVELNGSVVRKSVVGDETFAVMKSMSVEIAKANERIEKAEAAAELERLAKSADDGLAALPGDRITKARILKASQALSTEDKAAFDAMLKAANSSLAKAFTTVGKSGGKSETDEGSAEDKLQKKAEEIAKRDSVTIEKAYVRAMDENPSLYAEIEVAKASGE